MPTVATIGLPRIQKLSNAGKPLVGGTIYTYNAGTTTLATTYTDATGTVPNTNPIVLDARGECVVWIDVTKAYKFVTRDRTGALVSSDDNVRIPLSPGSDDGTVALAALASSASNKGSSLVNFLAPFPGAIAQPVSGKLGLVVDVTDFGAKGSASLSDTTDYTSQIQRAIDEVSTAGFGTVKFPRGIYRGNVVVDSSSVELVGTSASYLAGTSTSAWTLDFTGSASQCQLTNLGVICTVAGQSNTVGAVRFQNQGNVVVDRLRISGLGGHQFANGLKLEGGSGVSIRDTQIFNTSSNSLWATQVGGVTLINTLTSGDADGYVLDGVDGLWAFNAYTAGNGGNGWVVRKTGAGDNHNWFLHGCGGDSSGGYNWQITSGYRIYFFGGWGATQRSTTASPAASGMILSGSGVHDIELHGCYMGNNNKHGLEVLGGAYNVTVLGGGYESNGNGGSGSGIAVGGTSYGVRIMGARAGDTRATGTKNQEYGIQVTDSVRDLVVSDNDLRDNKTGPLIDTAAPTADRRYHDNLGFDPIGLFLTPAVAASGVPVTNMTGVTTRVIYGSSGSVTGVALNGLSTGLTGNGFVLLGPGETIALTYTGTAFWGWYGL